MTLAPLLNASPAIQFHAFAAMAAFALGLVQLAAPKGTIPHRAIGWAWVALMAMVAVTAFFIHEIRLWGPWSPIHLLAIYTLIMLPLAVLHARKHRVVNHRSDDQHFRRRADHRRRLHLPARPRHARRRVRSVTVRQTPPGRRRSRIAPRAPRG
jgi:uncharacterized membrane protein